MSWQVLEGDCVALLRSMPSNSIDAVVTDPPYGIDFMGKDWDAPTALDAKNTDRSAKFYAKAARDKLMSSEEAARLSRIEGRKFYAWCTEWSAQCLRVLKPGGHLLAFGGTRTYHRMTCAIEDAGFEIRDSIHWIYGSGFPKSLDVSKAIDKAAGAEREVVGKRTDGRYAYLGCDITGGRTIGGESGTREIGIITAPATEAARQWAGWGTALKPAHEPCVVARKPLVGTVAANVLAHGTGAINVDGCRVEWAGPADSAAAAAAAGFEAARMAGRVVQSSSMGRESRDGSEHYDPTNVSGRWPANVVLDEDAGRELDEQSGQRKAGGVVRTVKQGFAGRSYMSGGRGCDESPGYSDAGGASRFFYCAKASRADRGEGNTHATVKPTTLMRWLVRLVTPPGGIVLDPFTGSGSTGVAAIREGFRFVGCEMSKEYAAIARARIQQVTEEGDCDEEEG